MEYNNLLRGEMGVHAKNDVNHTLGNQNCATDGSHDLSLQPPHVPRNIGVDDEEKGENPLGERRQPTQEVNYPSRGHPQREDPHLTHPYVGSRPNIPPHQGVNPHVEFEMPTRTKYDGTTDPLVHISDFNTLMQAHQVIRNLKCVLFLATLSGATFSWFKKFKRHSIVSWQQLSNAFKKEFQAARTHKLKCSSLANMRQFLGESLKAYINFFNIEATKTHGINDSARLMALVVGIAHGSVFWNNLQGNSCAPLKNS
ncbi:hypothetical protein F8388_013602 [Cannabis sativa]|uniref:Retrotransposon gag domain-containing protein n=1 Tax=Cannabis sativa TaxID=3483 RepID=A0A7J6DVN7_CANSA|nr:hypothetical protein F8388_013602 [Cannabis sativa]